MKASIDLTSAVLLVVYILISATALIVLRGSLPQALPQLRAGDWLTPNTLAALGGAALYITSFLIWLGILARTPVTLAFPIAAGASMALTAAGAALVLGERMTVTQHVGLVLVIAGVALLSRA